MVDYAHNISLILGIADYLGCSTDDLLGRIDNPASISPIKYVSYGGDSDMPQELLEEMVKIDLEEKIDRAKLEIVNLIRDNKYTLEQLDIIKTNISALKQYFDKK